MEYNFGVSIYIYIVSLNEQHVVLDVSHVIRTLARWELIMFVHLSYIIKI